MRIGIYVYEKTTIEITPKADIVVEQLQSESTPAVAKVDGAGTSLDLDAGIYRIVADDDSHVRIGASSGAELVFKAGKDGWPDPPTKLEKVVKAAGGKERFCDFFYAKGGGKL